MAGNLITQTDALAQTLWFKYDAVNRLTEKRVTNSTGAMLASNTYDSAASASYTSGGDRVITTTDGGDLSVSTAAAMKNTYGMQALIDNTTSIYVRDDTPAGETRYRARFYFDPNSITMAANDSHTIFQGLNASSTSIIQVNFSYESSSYKILVQSRKDDATWDNTAKYTITDASHYIEIDWQAASGAGANDGSLTLWIDGTLKETRSALDNDTYTIDQAKLGPLYGIDAGTSGTEYFDAFESRRANYIRGSAPGKAGLYRVVTTERHKWGSKPIEVVGRRRVPSAPLLAPPTGQIWKQYYYAGAQRIAMRELVGATGNTLYYLLGDHLGSTALTADANGAKVAELRYKAWGENRYTRGTTPTSYKYTGQRHESELDEMQGLYFYNSRWYDPAVGRFLQADTIVPGAGNPQSFNRYSYVLNSPLKYIDPTGHRECGDGSGDENCDGISDSPSNETNPQGIDKTIIPASTANLIPTVADLFKLDPVAAIYWIANYYGIYLPPGVGWGYIEYLAGAYGWNPVDIDGDGQEELGEGSGIWGDDNLVYLSRIAFDTFAFDPAGVILTMIHEGRHAWVEYYIESAGGTIDFSATNYAMEIDAEYAARIASAYGIPLSSAAWSDSNNYNVTRCGKPNCPPTTPLLVAFYGVPLPFDDMYTPPYSGGN